MTRTNHDPITQGGDASILDKNELSRLKGQLRSQAERIVVDNHRDEYYQAAERLFAEHGLEFTRRLSASEKAERQIEDLLSQHPELKGRYRQLDRSSLDDTEPEDQGDRPF